MTFCIGNGCTELFYGVDNGWLVCALVIGAFMVGAVFGALVRRMQ